MGAKQSKPGASQVPMRRKTIKNLKPAKKADAPVPTDKQDGENPPEPKDPTRRSPPPPQVPLEQPSEQTTPAVPNEPTLPRLQRPVPPIPAPAPPKDKEHRAYRALYDYDGQDEGDLTFRRGDVILVVETINQNGSSSRWLKGEVVGADGRTGFVPGNFLADVRPDDPKLLAGYYNFGRQDAEKELVRAAHQVGSFILRPCSNTTEQLALSVKYKHANAFKIYHYKIRRDPNGVLVYISNSKKFPTVSDLLQYYSTESGLVCRLTTPVSTDARPVVPFRELQIDEQKVKCLAKLGSGSFGVVLRGKLLDKIDVAVKQLKMESTINTEDSLIEEAQTQYQLSHRNIIQLIGYTRTATGQFWLIMEYAEKGSLHSHLSNKKLDFSHQIDYIRQVSNGMAYLEREQVVHRDLRAANILLTDKDELKIADFGLARVIEKSDSTYSAQVGVYNGGKDCRFPIRWTAPEGINKHQFSVKSDVWSFGVCVYEILSHGKKPYQDKNNQQVAEFVNSGHRLENPLEGRFPREDQRSKQAKYLYEEVMLNCWREGPEERPTFESLSMLFDDFETFVSSRVHMYD